MSVPAPARVLLPAGTRVAWPTRPEDVARVMVLPRGTAVALADRRPGARGRLRRAAGRLGVRVEAEYIVLPSWGHAAFVAADDPAAVRWLLSTFTTTPPRVTRGVPHRGASARDRARQQHEGGGSRHPAGDRCPCAGSNPRRDPAMTTTVLGTNPGDLLRSTLRDHSGRSRRRSSCSPCRGTRTPRRSSSRSRPPTRRRASSSRRR